MWQASGCRRHNIWGLFGCLPLFWTRPPGPVSEENEFKPLGFLPFAGHQDLMQDFEKGKLESFKQEHAVLKEKQLRLLKEVGIAKHVDDHI